MWQYLKPIHYLLIPIDGISYYLSVFFRYFFYFVIIFRIGLYFWKNYIVKQNIWKGGPNSWAVVTGGTDGIGLEFCRQLAAKGYNIFILSRNQQKLDRVQKEIEEIHKVKCKTLAVDFRRDDIYTDIANELKKIGEVDNDEDDNKQSSSAGTAEQAGPSGTDDADHSCEVTEPNEPVQAE